MNDQAKMSLIANTPEYLLKGFAPFERAFIMAVKKFQEKETAKTGKDSKM